MTTYISELDLFKIAGGKSKNSQNNERKIWFGNLAAHTHEGNLKKLLQRAGEVTSIRIITDRKTGASKCYGFATFADERAAQRAAETLDGEVVIASFMLCAMMCSAVMLIDAVVGR